MLFSSIPFLYFFFPITIILYIVAPKKFKNFVLLASSLFFYFWGEKLLVLLFALSIFVTWVFGLLIEKTRSKGWDKLLLAVCTVFCLGLLGYFKYTDFFIENINALFKSEIPLLKIALPIGISFYTFQILSYVIDVYRQEVPAQKNLINYAAYVSLFPQLIAGPIVRYSDIAAQLEERTHSVEKISAGIKRFLTGLGKKVLIANVLGEICTAFRASNEPSVLFYWLYAVAFMLQIFFDFSGYSDMAIGLGKIFGFDFMENFNYPYISSSITEFWRRWHISLGSWFRDYVYIPLGGNRKGIIRQLFNIAVVWMLTGLWHGAEWNFVLWGVFYAVLLTIEKLGFKKFIDKHKGIGHIYVLMAVLLGFVLFNASSLSQTLSDIQGLFSFGKIPLYTKESLYYLRSYAFVFVLGFIGSTPLLKNIYKKIEETSVGEKLLAFAEPIMLTGLLAIVTAYLVDGSFNPFLYFRF